MKRSLLVAGLLFTAAASADDMDFATAKARIDSAQKDYDATLTRVEDLKGQISSEQQKMAASSGKEEHAQTMEQSKSQCRALMDQHNQAIEACNEKLARLQAEVAQIGKSHTVTSSGSKFAVQKPVERQLEPIRVSEPARQPYATGNGYPRAAYSA